MARRWLVLAVCVAAAGAQSAPDCKAVEAKGGYKFDLTTDTGLTTTVSFSDSTSAQSYFVVACGKATAPTGFSCTESVPDNVGYQIDGAFKCWALGDSSKGEWTYDKATKKLTAEYTGGADRDGGKSNKMLVEITCAESGTKPSAATEATTLEYTLKWNSPAVCSPTGGGGGAGGGMTGVEVSVLVFFVGGISLLGMGTVYKWKVKGESGTDAIPFKDTIKDIPFLVKDGVSFAAGRTKVVVNKVTGRYENL